MSLRPAKNVPDAVASVARFTNGPSGQSGGEPSSGRRASTVSSMLGLWPGYARVLNPPTTRSGETRRWSDFSSTEVTGETQWDQLVAADGARVHGVEEPEMGSLDPGVAEHLASVLGRRTTTPEACTFLIWEGYTGLRPELVEAPMVTVSQDRQMYVLSGSIRDAVESFESESRRLPLWWIPADGAWCVGNDIYARSVYVGGDAKTIGAVLGDPALEAVYVRGDQFVNVEDRG